MKIKIKRKGWFCVGVINILLALANIVLKVSGNGTELALVAIFVCAISGIRAIIDSLEYVTNRKPREKTEQDNKDGADDSSLCCYSGVKCYSDDCATCKERTDYFKET